MLALNWGLWRDADLPENFISRFAVDLQGFGGPERLGGPFVSTVKLGQPTVAHSFESLW